MKKLLTLFLALPLLFVACSSSDDDSLDAALIGKWNFHEIKLEVDATPQSAKEAIEKYFMDEMSLKYNLEFKSNDTVEFDYFDDDDTDVCKAWTKGNKLYLKDDEETNVSRYNILDNMLEIENDLTKDILEEIQDDPSQLELPADFKLNKAILKSYFKAVK